MTKMAQCCNTRFSSNGQSWSAKEVRRLKVPSQPEGCVADDQNDLLFLGEEDVGVWRFAADAKADTKGELVIKADGDVLVADVEGLALLPAEPGNPPYLLASSQGNDSYVLFQATAPYKAVARFRIRLNSELGIDGSSETDGLELTTLSLGKGFEQGAVIVQDGRNRMPEARSEPETGASKAGIGIVTNSIITRKQTNKRPEQMFPPFQHVLPN